MFQSNQTVKQAIMSQPDSVIYGKWQLFQSENFENFMSRLGVSYLVRKLGNKSTPVVTVSKGDDDLLSFKQESLVSTSEIKFKLGEQFDEKSADGRMVKIFTYLLFLKTLKEFFTELNLHCDFTFCLTIRYCRFLLKITYILKHDSFNRTYLTFFS